MKDLAAGERLGRKFTCAPFIPHGRGLKLHEPSVHVILFYAISRKSQEWDLLVLFGLLFATPKITRPLGARYSFFLQFLENHKTHKTIKDFGLLFAKPKNYMTP